MRPSQVCPLSTSTPLTITIHQQRAALDRRVHADILPCRSLHLLLGSTDLMGGGCGWVTIRWWRRGCVHCSCTCKQWLQHAHCRLHFYFYLASPPFHMNLLIGSCSLLSTSTRLRSSVACGAGCAACEVKDPFHFHVSHSLEYGTPIEGQILRPTKHPPPSPAAGHSGLHYKKYVKL